MDVILKQIEFRLLDRRGVYWPAQRMLLVADPHLGKEATFRASGLAVPRGSTDGTLETISRMIDETSAEQLAILGDLFHARSSLAENVVESFTRFLDRHASMKIFLIKGNHDVHVGPLSRAWQLRVIDPPFVVDSVTLEHFPGPPTDESRICLAGHLHPSVRLSDAVMAAGKLPCFYFDASQSCLVLPAIGEFTGTATVQPTDRDRVWVLADGEVIEVASRPVSRRKSIHNGAIKK
jgi:DNA ligase-associated metallophosphoesterase